MIEDSGATRFSDLTVDVVERNLTQLKDLGKSARTENERRKDAIAFLNWAAKPGRVESNPLKVLPRLDESRDRRQVRRAATEDELARLLEVAEGLGT